MLNINKIESLITKGESNPSIVSRNTGINYQTLKSKLKSGFWSAEELEKLAGYFKKPISYFFDKEEPEQVAEPGGKYVCKNCIELKKELDELRVKYILLLEESNAKKENPPGDRKKVG